MIENFCTEAPELIGKIIKQKLLMRSAEENLKDQIEQSQKVISALTLGIDDNWTPTSKPSDVWGDDKSHAESLIVKYAGEWWFVTFQYHDYELLNVQITEFADNILDLDGDLE